MAIKSKTIKLRAFKVENNDPKYEKSPLLNLLGDKLSTSTKAEDRRIQINSDDPNEESDLIADFDISRKDSYIFGCVIKVVTSKGTPSLPDDVFNEKTIPFTKLGELGLKDKFIYRSHFYFATDGKHLIVTLPSNKTITAFQAYINEYLKTERKNHLFEFTPKIVNILQTAAKEIKSVKFKDSKVNLHSAGNPPTNTVKTKILSLKSDLLKLILEDTPNLDKILDENLVSAEIFLKFAANKNQDAQNFYGAILKPLADTDNIVIKTKSGSTIKGSKLQDSRSVEIGITESGLISETELYQAMENFLIDLAK